MIKKIAVVADIHANKYALDIFFKYINNENIKCVLNLGDFVQIGPNPYEVSTKVIDDEIYWEIMKLACLKLMIIIKIMRIYIEFGRENKYQKI